VRGRRRYTRRTIINHLSTPRHLIKSPGDLACSMRVTGYSGYNIEQIRKPMMMSGQSRERDEEGDAGWAAGKGG